MKIALIHSIYKPYTRGGAEVVVGNVTSGLKSQQKDFFVITLGYEDKIEDVDGVKVYRIKPCNVFNYLDILEQPIWKRFFWHIFDVFNFCQAYKVYKILKREKPNLALTHSLKGLGYLTLPLINLLKIKNIHTIHDMQLISPTGLLPKKSLSFLEGIYLQICKSLFSAPPTVVFPSEFIKRIYSRFGFFKKSRLEILSNPILLPKSLSDKPVNKKFTFGFLGQVEEYKGIFDLIEALKSVGGTEWKLIIAGTGRDWEKIKSIYKDNSQIEFLGQVGQADLERVFWSEINVLVNPSQVAESFGMSILEANSFGIPVLVSKVGAFVELVKENKTGWLFEPKNVLDLGSKLNFLITHQEEVLSLKQNCLFEASCFSIDNYLNRVLTI